MDVSRGHRHHRFSAGRRMQAADQSPSFRLFSPKLCFLCEVLEHTTPCCQRLPASLAMTPALSWDLRCPFCLALADRPTAVSSPALFPVLLSLWPPCCPSDMFSSNIFEHLMFLPLGPLLSQTFTSCSPFQVPLWRHLLRDTRSPSATPTLTRSPPREPRSSLALR